MNRAIIQNTIRERFTSRIRVALLICFAAMPVIIEAIAKRRVFPQPDDMTLLVWILGAGIIGREVTSGILQLVLVRPLTRSDYVFSKYLALAISISTFAVLQWLGVCIVLATQSAFEWQAALYSISSLIVSAFGYAAVVILFSALVPGFGDVGLYILLSIIVSVVQIGRSSPVWKHLATVGTHLNAFLDPVIHIERLFAFTSAPTAVSSISWYFFVITFSLAVAILLMNQKELSYAAAD